PSCKTTILWKDLIPLLSFVLLRGTCRACHARIPWQYPFVEASMGCLFVFIGMWHLRQSEALFFPALYRDLFIVVVLFAIFLYDLYYQEIPDLLTIPAIVILFIISLFLPGPSVFSLLLAMSIGGGIFLFQYAISKGAWIGGGDIRLGILMGALLGWPIILVALFLAYVGGALVSCCLLALKKKGLKSEVPFGTFLTVATFFSMLWGSDILAWYLHFLS
ncbi:MAG TPA: prepilin peptidase, partial [Candidatus Kapabacteria bacterium]|nr:prepilin peptidase [Candidatus Kapabacteria bacterium]